MRVGVRGNQARDESGGVGVLPFAERVCLPEVRELVGASARVAIKGSGVWVVSGNFGIER